jgi:predicted ester cyclase
LTPPLLELARRLELEVWGEGRLEVLDEIAKPTYTVHDVGLGRSIEGREAVRDEMREFRAAFAIERVTIDDAVVGDSSVVIRWTMFGTHTLEFEGVAPTGRKIESRGVDLMHVEEGRLAETWVVCSDLDLLNQISRAR